MAENRDNFLVEILLIIAGFIFSETVVRNMFDVLGEGLSQVFWIAICIILVFLAYSIKERTFLNDLTKFNFIVLLIGVILLYLAKIGVVFPSILALWVYAWFIGQLIVLYLSFRSKS